MRIFCTAIKIRHLAATPAHRWIKAECEYLGRTVSHLSASSYDRPLSG